MNIEKKFKYLFKFSKEEQLLDFCNEIGENSYVECKRKSNPDNPKLDNPDKKNLGKALSGFSNYDGGILIFGVEELKQDSIFKPSPIKNIRKFKNNVMAIAGTICQPSINIEKHKIIKSSKNKDDGYLILFIERGTIPPYSYDNRFYQRGTEEFIPINGLILKDIINRKTIPNIEIIITHESSSYQDGKWYPKFIFELSNNGNISCHHFFIQNIHIDFISDKTKYNKNFNIETKDTASNKDNNFFIKVNNKTFLSRDFVSPPKSLIPLLKVIPTIKINYNSNNNYFNKEEYIRISYEYGADNISLKKQEIIITSDDLNNLWKYKGDYKKSFQKIPL